MPRKVCHEVSQCLVMLARGGPNFFLTKSKNVRKNQRGPKMKSCNQNLGELVCQQTGAKTKDKK